jgi:ketosteroid isomerase-like protein
MNDELLLQTEAMCTRTLLAFYNALDAGRARDAVKAFTHDAVWMRMGDPLNGREAISRVLEDRFPDTVIRHLVSNVEFENVSHEHADSQALVTVYAGSPGQGGKPATLQLRAVVDAITAYEKTEEGWRIKSHAGHIRMLAS